MTKNKFFINILCKKYFILVFFLFFLVSNFVFANPCETVTTDGAYTIHTFTCDGTFTPPVGVTSVEALVVAGGGGGGFSAGGVSCGSGGGGAGGLVYNNSYIINGSAINVVVGNGGNGGISATVTYAESGGNSSFSNLVAVGGGGGGFCNADAWAGSNGGNGGSGGGVYQGGYGDVPLPGSGIVGQGYDGAVGGGWDSGGGGGGSSELPGGGEYSFENYGGDGSPYNITGSLVYYAGGGAGGNGGDVLGGLGGGGNSSVAFAYPGTPNTGGGGGGVWGGDNDGGAGGSGIVIVRYQTPVLQTLGQMFSTNYIMEVDSINFGGTENSLAGDFVLSDTMGEVSTGVSSSTNYAISAGYRTLTGSYISISAADDVVIPTMTGLTPGESNSAESWLVKTDNPAGYELLIKSLTSPAMISVEGASFSDYTTSASGTPDYIFSVAPTDSVFAFSPEGEDISQTYLDDGVDCGTGNYDTADRCWDGFLTTEKVIAYRTTSNHPDGTITNVKYKTAIGSSKIQDAGTYTSTIQVTAVTL